MSQKKQFYKIAFISFLLIIFTFFILSISKNFISHFADISDNTNNIDITTEFKIAIETNNLEYFKKISSQNNNTLNNLEKFKKNAFEPFKHKLDIFVFQKENHVFFSFLGLKKNSSVLYNIFGTYNKKTKKLENLPTLSIKIINLDKNAKTITIQNTSNTILPIKNSLMIMPQNIKIENINSVDFTELIKPNQKITFNILEYNINRLNNLSINKIDYIESIDFGYILNKF